MRKIFLLVTALLLSCVSVSAAKKFVKLTSDNIDKVTTDTRCIFVSTMPSNYSVEAARDKSYVMTATASGNYLAGEEIQLNADGSVTPTTNTLITSVNISGATWEFFQWTEAGVSSKGLYSAGNNRLTVGTTITKWNVKATDTGVSILVNGGTAPILSGCNSTAPYASFFLRTSATLAGNGVYLYPDLYVELEAGDTPEPPVVEGDGTINNPWVVTSLSDVIEKEGFYYVKDVELTATYVDNWASYHYGFYAQNDDIAMEFEASWIGDDAVAQGKALKEGDTFKNFWLQVQAPMGMYGWTYSLRGVDANGVIPSGFGATVVSYYDITGNTPATPKEVTLDQLGDNVNRLVVVNDVTFKNITAGQTFETSKSGWSTVVTAYPVSSGSLEGNVTPLLYSNVYGSAIPTSAVNVTGIGAANNTVMPRATTDLVVAEVPVVEDGTYEHPYTITSLADATTAFKYYRFKGEVVVSYAETAKAFLQAEDNSAACRLTLDTWDENAALKFGDGLKIGDKVTDIIIKPYSSSSVRNKYYYLYKNSEGIPYTVVSQNNTVTPVDVTVGNITNVNFLVKLDKVAITGMMDGTNQIVEVPADSKFSGTYNYVLSQEGITETSQLSIFAGSPMLQETVPTGNINLTGIVEFSNIVYPRSAADIEVLAAPAKPAITVDATTIDVAGVAPVVKKLVVKGTDLTADITLTLTDGITADKNVITKEEAMSENGCTVTLTVEPAVAGSFTGKVTLSSTDAESVEVALSGDITFPAPVFTFYSKAPNGTFIKKPSAAYTGLNGTNTRVANVYFQVQNAATGLTIDCPEMVTANKTTFTKDELNEGTCQVDFTITPENSGDFTTTVTFKMEGADDVELSLSGNITIVKEVTSLADVIEKTGAYYVKDTEVTVSYVTSPSEYETYAYIQNDDAALCLSVPQNAPTGDQALKQGVTFKNFWVLPKKSAAGVWVYNLYGSNADNTSYGDQFNYEITATDTELTPKVVTAEELDANANRLVKLENVTFQNVEEGQAFSKTAQDTGAGGTVMVATAYDVKAGEADAKVEPFVTSDIYGNDIPTEAMNIVGIAAANSTIMPRAMTDMTAATVIPEEPTITLSVTDVVKLSAVVGEQATQAVTLTMKNCTAPVVITAKEAANEITLSTMSIEPTEEPVEIIVTFAPTKDGVVKQQFEITTEGLEEAVVLSVEGSGVNFIAMLTADADGMYRVYSVNGMLLLETKDQVALKSLTPGLYIINGRKYMLR